MSYLVFVSVFMISPNCVGVVWCQIQNKAARENSCSTSSYEPPRTVRVSTTISILLYEFLRPFPSYCTSSYDTLPLTVRVPTTLSPCLTCASFPFSECAKWDVITKRRECLIWTVPALKRPLNIVSVQTVAFEKLRICLE